MVTPITHVTQPQAAEQPTPARQPSPPQPTPQPAPRDTVTISAAAAQRQELTETAAQTAKEASQGDAQARRLQAREAAERKAGL